MIVMQIRSRCLGIGGKAKAVLGHLNRYKAYPEEAKRKGVRGAPKVRFIVDGQKVGVIACELINSSGVRSLDKEAQSVIKRAQPLPKPQKNCF